MDVVSLCNIVLSLTTSYREWEDELKSAMKNGASIQELASIGEQLIQAPFVITDAYGTLLGYSSQTLQIPQMSKVVSQGYVTPENKPALQYIDITEPTLSGGFEIGSGLYRLTKVLTYADVVVASIEVLLSDTSNKSAVLQLLQVFSDYIGKVLSIENQAMNETDARYQDYYLYHLIDTCMRSEEYAARPSRLLYLCSYELFVLCKYDYNNHTTYCELLRTYCELLRTYYENDKNINETAHALFFHRNSVANKLEKIRDLVNQDINDVNFQNRMVFSFAILDYVTKYKGLSIEEKTNERI